MADLTTRTLPAAEYDQWDTFVSQSPDGSPYSTARYLDILCRATGGSFKVLVADKGSEIVLLGEERGGRQGKGKGHTL